MSHGGNVFGVISASYTDKGGPGGVPPLSTDQPGPDPPEAPGGRERRQPVRHERRRPTPTARGPGVHRGSLAAADWIQLNGPFNLFQADTITFRVADVQPAAGRRTAGSPLAAIEIRQDVDGPILTTANLVSTGGTAVWSSQTFPISLAGKHELFFVFRAVTGGATGGNLFNLNWAEFNGNGIASP